MAPFGTDAGVKRRRMRAYHHVRKYLTDGRGRAGGGVASLYSSKSATGRLLLYLSLYVYMFEQMNGLKAD